MGDPGGMMQGPAMRASVLLAIGVLAIAHGVMEEDMAVQDLGGGDPAGDRAIEDQVLAEAKMSNYHINSADQEDRIDSADDSDFSASKDPKRQLQRAAEGSDSFQNELQAIEGTLKPHSGGQDVDTFAESKPELGASQGNAQKSGTRVKTAEEQRECKQKDAAKKQAPKKGNLLKVIDEQKKKVASKDPKVEQARKSKVKEN